MATADITVFKKCCFYIPLRHGVILWACLSLIIALSFIGVNISETVYVFRDTAGGIILYMLSLVVSIVHVLYNVMVIVAVHKENRNMVECYYNYSKIRIVVYAVVFVVLNILDLTDVIDGFYVADICQPWGGLFLVYRELAILDLVLQGYFTIVVRSYMLEQGTGVEGYEEILSLPSENYQPIADCTIDIERQGQEKGNQRIIIKGININLRTSQQLTLN